VIQLTPCWRSTAFQDARAPAVTRTHATDDGRGGVCWGVGCDLPLTFAQKP